MKNEQVSVTSDVTSAREPWEPMTLRFEGDSRDLIQGGVAKSGSAHDPGDAGKPPGQESI